MLAQRVARDRNRPTGLVAVNDILAFGLLAGFRDAGLAVPQEVSVIGMDGLFLSSFTIPGLTTIRLPVPAMARTIVERVVGRMADPHIVPDEFLFAPELEERESVAAPRAVTRPRQKVRR
jgi:DNA-binding LacI/PurR family transcriptional regulator